MASSQHGSYAYQDTLKGIYFGPGCLESALPQLLRTLGGTKALIVTGKSLREKVRSSHLNEYAATNVNWSHWKTNVVTNVERILRDNNAFGGAFSDIGQHAPVQGIINGIKAFHDTGADIFVSVGGGSPIDATKAMIYRIHEAQGKFFGNIAIPTTLSAAEYTVRIPSYANSFWA